MRKFFRYSNPPSIVCVAMLVVLLSGCAGTPGLVPSLGGRTVIEREFHDSDSAYSETIKAPAGVDVSKLSRFSLKLEDGANDIKYEVGLDSADTVDTEDQAVLLAKISADTLASLRSALTTLEAMAPSIAALLSPVPAVAPLINIPLSVGPK